MLAQAKRLDNGGVVEGYLYKFYNETFETHSYYIFIDHNKMFHNKINPQTLKYKVGDSWYSEGEITDRLASLDRVNEIFEGIKRGVME